MQTLSQQFLESFHHLPQGKNAQFLLTVSGGIDSMVLCDLFGKYELNFSVAHCNFQLREDESEKDQQFVESYCQERNIRFFTQRFDVALFKHSGNYSTQMAARELRYAWFDELAQTHNFDWIVTAHHLNDSLETLLINLSRGTGLQGLQGISMVKDKLFRPLIQISREQILQYAQENQILWREDHSNASDDYLRNQIRHHLVPKLMDLNSNFLQNFAHTTDKLRDEQKLLQNHLNDIKNRLFEIQQDEIHIRIDLLEELNPIKTYLFHLFKAYGFAHPEEIQKLFYAENSAEISSISHRLIKNRNELILVAQKKSSNEEEFTFTLQEIPKNPLNLVISKSDSRDNSALESLDLEKIHFPLKLRKPKIGDGFYPLGMKGFKKISKFLKDLKLSKTEKEKVWLLVDAQENVLYVVGYRIDERFKLNENTHKFLNIFLC